MLPYHVDPAGRTKVLLAYDERGFWSDLGGGRQYVLSARHPEPRCETHEETAVREAWEESHYLLSRQLLRGALATAKVTPAAPGRDDFVTYTIRIDALDLEPFFETWVVEGSGAAETSDIAWFELEELLRVAEEGRRTLNSPNGKPLRDVFWNDLAAKLPPRARP